MIETGESIIIGVSGGADSVCLLHFLGRLKKEWHFEITAVHVNHMLRGVEAERDKNFVKSLCDELGVECFTANIDVRTLARTKKMTIEEAGRAARYLAFDTVARQLQDKGVYRGAKVALAHHRDDNVETVLLNLIRGTGLAGLKGIAPVAARDRLTLIRPLLCIGREDIEEYLSAYALPHVEDSTNAENEFARNKIRNEIIPRLKLINNRASEHISETAWSLSQLQDFMDRHVQDAMDRVVDRRDDVIAVNVKDLKALEPALQTAIMHQSIGLAAGSMKDISHINIMDALSLADKQTGRRIELPYGIVAMRSYSNIVLSNRDMRKDSSRKDHDRGQVHMAMDRFVEISLYELKNRNLVLNLADGGSITFGLTDVNDSNRAALTEKNIYTKAFDCDTIKDTLILGKPQDGDELKFAGGTKTLKKYFADEKIPAEYRDDMLVLKDMDGVLWVLGYRIGEPYKITQSTTKALVVSIAGGNDEQ